VRGTAGVRRDAHNGERKKGRTAAPEPYHRRPRRRAGLRRRWVDPRETGTSPPDPDQRKGEEAVQHQIRELPLGIGRAVAGIGVEGRRHPLVS
jgi:hypothetical protein